MCVFGKRICLQISPKESSLNPLFINNIVRAIDSIFSFLIFKKACCGLVHFVSRAVSIVSKNRKTSAKKNTAGRTLGFVIISAFFGIGAFGWSQLGARSTNLSLARSHTNSIKPLRTLDNEGHWVHSVVVSPDGSTIISGDHKGQLKWWNAKTGALANVTKDQGHSDAVSALAVSLDGQTIVSGSWDNRVKVWDTKTGDLLRTLRHNNDVRALDISPSGEVLASGGVDGTVRLWDLRTGQTIRRMKTDSWITSIVYHPKGDHVALGNRNGSVKIWQLGINSKPRLLHSLNAHKGAVAGLAFSPDGRTLASGSADKTIKVWDVAQGNILKAFAGHAEEIRSLAFSTDGHTLASSSNDETVKLWSLDTGAILGNLVGHGKTVWDVAFSPDGQQVVSAGSDTTLKMWPVPSPSVVSEPEGSLNPPEQREVEAVIDQRAVQTVYSSGKVVRLQPKVEAFAEVK